jgi:hypothetical protein
MGGALAIGAMQRRVAGLAQALAFCRLMAVGRALRPGFRE